MITSLNSAMAGATSALDAFQYALNVTQNDVDNASTPGYASQSVALQADAFDPSEGLGGGVADGQMINSRDLLAESDVWQQSSAQGDATAQANALTAIQNGIPVAQGSGIPAAMNTFFSDISAWSAAPTNESAQQQVMVDAGALAQSFQATVAAVSTASQNVTQEISNSVNQINDLTSQIATLNSDLQNGGANNQGLQAQLYSSLQTLSGLVNINVLQQPDGGVNVTLSSGDALVMGDQSYAITSGAAPVPAASTDPLASPDIDIQGADGTVLNSQITSGTLAGLLQVRNVTIPGLIGDPSQPGALNTLASTLASTVNNIIQNGVISEGPPVVQPATGLFTFTDATSASAAASTMTVDPGMTASQLPAIDQNGVANGTPLALAALATSANAALGNASFTTFYGNTAAGVGSQLNAANNSQTLTTQTLAQAQSMRQSISGVSLDAEAATLMQYQSGYQAVAKMVSTLETLTQTLIDLIPAS